MARPASPQRTVRPARPPTRGTHTRRSRSPHPSASDAAAAAVAIFRRGVPCSQRLSCRRPLRHAPLRQPVARLTLRGLRRPSCASRAVQSHHPRHQSWCVFVPRRARPGPRRCCRWALPADGSAREQEPVPPEKAAEAVAHCVNLFTRGKEQLARHEAARQRRAEEKLKQQVVAVAVPSSLPRRRSALSRRAASSLLRTQ
jgi:hypothetical protein